MSIKWSLLCYDYIDNNEVKARTNSQPNQAGLPSLLLQPTKAGTPLSKRTTRIFLFSITMAKRIKQSLEITLSLWRHSNPKLRLSLTWNNYWRTTIIPNKSNYCRIGRILSQSFFSRSCLQLSLIDNLPDGQTHQKNSALETYNEFSWGKIKTQHHMHHSP